MSQLLRRSLVLAVVLSVMVRPAASQEAADSDAQRLEEARKEQKERQAEERRQAEAAAAEAADAERKAELEKLGVEQDAMPIEESPGLFAQVEGAWMSLDGAERTVATQYDVTTTAVTAEDLDTNGDGLPDAYTRGAGRDLRLTYDEAVSPVIEFGYRLKKGGAFSVRWFDFSSDASVAADSTRSFPSSTGSGGLVLGGIDTPALASSAANYALDPTAFDRPFGSPLQLTSLGLHGADSVRASGTLEATRFDLLFTRTALATKRVEVVYRLGATRLETSRQEDATFQWTSFSLSEVQGGKSSTETLRTSAETVGYGVTVGTWARFGLTADRKWAIRAGVELAGLQADQNLSYANWSQTEQPGLPTPPPTRFQDTTNDDAGQFVSTMELDAAVEGRLGSRVRLALGYRLGRWADALTNERYPSAANPSALSSQGVDLDVSGAYLRLGFFF